MSTSSEVTVPDSKRGCISLATEPFHGLREHGVDTCPTVARPQGLTEGGLSLSAYQITLG